MKRQDSILANFYHQKVPKLPKYQGDKKGSQVGGFFLPQMPIMPAPIQLIGNLINAFSRKKAKPVKVPSDLEETIHLNLKDPRKVRMTTGKQMNPNRDLMSGDYVLNEMGEAIKRAKKRGLSLDDAWNMAAIDFQETLLGNRDNEMGHAKDYQGEDNIDRFLNAYQDKMKTADRLKYKDPYLRLQVYNGLGKVYPETEQWYHGFKANSFYGVPVPKTGLDLKKNPLYGKQIIDLRDNVLRKNPEFVKFINTAYGAGMKRNGGMITDPRGQWAHPGKNTRIPGGNITMQGVPYPVLGKANNGMTTMMYPGQDYSFPGADYVDEYPMMQKGGRAPVYVNNPNDPRLKLYNDSLSTFKRSQNPWFWEGTKVTTKQDYEKKLAEQRKFPYWAFDEDQYKKDKKKGKFKDFNDYVYNVGLANKPGSREADAHQRNVGKDFENLETPIEKKLSDGKIKQYWTKYKGKLLDDTYDIYDPTTGSTSNYSNNRFIGLYNPNIQPVRHIYHAFDKPYSTGSFNVSSEDSEYVNKVLKNKSKKKKDYINYTYGANETGIYKEPVQPVIYDKKKYNPNDPRLKQLQDAFDKFHGGLKGGFKKQTEPTSSKPKQPLEPTLKPRPFVPATKLPMGQPSQGMRITERQFPNIVAPDVEMSGPYMVGYHDYDTQEGIDRGFRTAEERDAFVEELRQRQAGNYQPSMMNISSYYDVNKRKKKAYGGLIKAQNGLDASLEEFGIVDPNKERYALGMVPNTPVSGESFEKGAADANEFLRNWYSGRVDDPRYGNVAKQRLNMLSKIPTKPADSEFLKKKGWAAYHDPRTSAVYIDANDPYSRAASTQAHELHHALYYETPQEDQDQIIMPLRMKKKQWKKENPELAKNPRNWGDIGRPTEIASRLSEFRRRYGIDPSKKYTSEEMKKIMDAHKKRYSSGFTVDQKKSDAMSGDRNIDDLFNMIGNDPAKLAELNDEIVMNQKAMGNNVAKYGGLTKYQVKGQVSQEDSVRHLAGQIMDFEARKGSAQGTGLSNFGNPALGNNPTKEQAVGWFMKNVAPGLGAFQTAMEKGEAGDFVYNSGRDPRVYMLDQYLKSIGQAGLPNRGSYNVDTKTSAWTPQLQQSLDDQWNTYKDAIYKLPVNTRRQLLNKGRDFYYQNINKKPDGSPSDAYHNTWKPRIWESVNTYKQQNGGDISIPNLRQAYYPMAYGGPMVRYMAGKMTGPNIF